MTKEYRVWKRRPGKDPRGSQGHYVIAKSPKEAISVVRRKGERSSQFEVILWKKDRRMTDKAKRLRDTGKY